VAETIVKGISEEGGLFVPANLSVLPKFSVAKLARLAAESYHSYQNIAFDIFFPLFDFALHIEDELRNSIGNAYSANFKTGDVTRLVALEDTGKCASYALELWHGPTAAFKDMALQALPGLMSLSKIMLKRGGEKTLILVATSGDTGKAALEGFKDAPGIEIAVFYPEEGVSDMQKLQMLTQEGANVHVFAVKGNFDDCQTAVKEAFADSEILAKASAAGVAFSSANSINWGRLFPQIVYYIDAYVQLIRRSAIKAGDKINICVPTGNFGNILAAYYAIQMGLPVNKLICASNSNNVLTDFINTGIYNRNREFCTTVSPSMDILVSSNLERLLFHFTGGDSTQINKWFDSLKTSGEFEIDNKLKAKIGKLFYGGWCDESDTAKTIKSVFMNNGYLMDTHTAVGHKVWRDYVKETGDIRTKTLIVSTANAYKFADSVYEALYGKFIPRMPSYDDMLNPNLSNFGMRDDDDVLPAVSDDALTRLSERTGIRLPASLAAVRNKEVRFSGKAVAKEQIKETVLKIITGTIYKER